MMGMGLEVKRCMGTAWKGTGTAGTAGTGDTGVGPRTGRSLAAGQAGCALPENEHSTPGGAASPVPVPLVAALTGR